MLLNPRTRRSYHKGKGSPGDNYTVSLIQRPLGNTQWDRRFIVVKEKLKLEFSGMPNETRINKAFATLRGLCFGMETVLSLNSFEKKYYEQEALIKFRKLRSNRSGSPESAVDWTAECVTYERASSMLSDVVAASDGVGSGVENPQVGDYGKGGIQNNERGSFDEHDIGSPGSSTTVLGPLTACTGLKPEPENYRPDQKLDYKETPSTHYLSPSSSAHLGAFSPMLSPVRESKAVEEIWRTESSHSKPLPHTPPKDFHLSPLKSVISPKGFRGRSRSEPINLGISPLDDIAKLGKTRSASSATAAFLKPIPERKCDSPKVNIDRRNFRGLESRTPVKPNTARTPPPRQTGTSINSIPRPAADDRRLFGGRLHTNYTDSGFHQRAPRNRPNVLPNTCSKIRQNTTENTEMGYLRPLSKNVDTTPRRNRSSRTFSTISNKSLVGKNDSNGSFATSAGTVHANDLRENSNTVIGGGGHSAISGPGILTDITGIECVSNPRTTPTTCHSWFGQHSTSYAKISKPNVLPRPGRSSINTEAQKENFRPNGRSHKQILQPGNVTPKQKSRSLTNWLSSSRMARGEYLIPQPQPNGNFSQEEVHTLTKRLSAQISQTPGQGNGFGVLGGRYYSLSIPNLDKSPSKDEKDRNPIAVCMGLINAASNESQSPRRERMLQMSRVMVDAISKSRDAESAAEEAKMAASRAEIAALRTKKHLAEITEMINQRRKENLEW